MSKIVSKRAGAVFAVTVGLCVAASFPALSQGYAPGGGDERSAQDQRPQGFGVHVDRDEHRNPRDFGFRFEGDERGNVEGKRAGCEVYAKIAQVQTDANHKFRCGYRGPRWDHDLEEHFRWCRHVTRETVGMELRERAGELQRCFDRLGDFDGEDRDDRR